MKKLLIAMCAAASMCAYAASEVESTNDEPVDDGLPIWGFGNYGIYSGYQLYGSLVNREPTLQGYFELNVNIPWDLGYLGAGVWNNSDLTCERKNNYGRIFNEFDFNVHWGKTFWFDDEKTWGLDYRASVVWYYYPHHLYQRNKPYGKTDTTMDFNHSFALVNPYVIPYINVVREYHENKANLLQFGVRKPWQVTDNFQLCPILEFVWRESRYNWCFPTGFGETNGGTNSGIATMKLELDATYMFTPNIGIFAKVAYCSIIDPDLRDNCDVLDRHAYGECKDFAWGGVGLTFSF